MHHLLLLCGGGDKQNPRPRSDVIRIPVPESEACKSGKPKSQLVGEQVGRMMLLLKNVT